MSKLNWGKKLKRNTTPKHVNQERVKRKLRGNEATYRSGNFWIGDQLIERYDPRKKERVVTGLTFNALSGRFEIWKDGERRSDIAWRVGQAALKEWKAKFY